MYENKFNMYLQYGGISNYIGTLCHVNEIKTIFLIEISRIFIFGGQFENNCRPKWLS